MFLVTISRMPNTSCQGISISPHNLILVVSDLFMDLVFGEILQEFSIEQRVIDTQTEP